MKKVFSLFALVFFMYGATYLLLNENKWRKQPSKKLSNTYYQNFISGKPKATFKSTSQRELQPFELQRQRINSESVYRFEGLGSPHEVYELHEDELVDSLRKFK